MKPIAIEFQAFGSYPGRETIDFSVLAERGLFVVAGDTGTGKSTIFDAMCFALYGVMPLKDGKEIRSHHAAIDHPTYVRFTFDVDGVRYVVERSPEQQRPARKGSGVTVDKATVSLARVDASGSQSLATKSADAVARCIEIVGLKVDQFKRVILLPQGDFAQFLRDGTTGREELLGQLFGGEIYDDIVDNLASREGELRRQVGSLQSDIDHRLDNAWLQTCRACDGLGIDLRSDNGADSGAGHGAGIGADDGAGNGSGAPAGRGADRDTPRRDVIDAALGSAAEPFAVLSDGAARASAEATRLLAAHAEARSAAARFDQASAYRISIGQLVARQPTIEADEMAAKASAQARIVVRSDDEVHAAHRRADQALTARDHRLARIADEFRGIGATIDLADASAVVRAVDAQRRLLEDWTQALDAHAAATQAERVAASALATLRVDQRTTADEMAAERERCTHLQTRLDVLAAAAVDVGALERRIAQAEAAVADRLSASTHEAALVAAARRCESAVADHGAALSRFVSTQAPRLAAELSAGEPCAVCGSRDHPAPARAGDVEPTTFEQVQQLSAMCTEADLARRSIEGKLAEARGRLGEDASRSSEELAAVVASLHHERAVARQSASELGALEREITSGNARLAAMGERSAGLAAGVEAAVRDLARCQRELTAAVASTEGIDVARVELTARAVHRLEPITADLSALFDEVLASTEGLRGAQLRCQAVLDGSDFASVASARDALIDVALEAARLRLAEELRRDLSDARAKLAALEEHGVPVERPDDEALHVRATSARALADELAVRHTTVRNALEDARTELVRHDALVVEAGDVRERHLVARRAHKVCSEGGAVNMPLRRWVLAVELDRVANAANVHLQRMTGGRYIVQRRQEVKDGRKAFGLDLEVLDAHTGRTRATSSLSGGEQFQASLALALGLADVVSHGGGASGKRFEALFVDEGFGSLDPVALQDAIAALHQLRATGRMVGVITHVEDMKRDLHVGIDVRRLGDGRGSTLVVHP